MPKKKLVQANPEQPLNEAVIGLESNNIKSKVSSIPIDEARRIYALFSNDIEAFGRFFFPHLLSRATPKFHKEIYEILPKYRFLTVLAPRGHAKTTVGLIIYPIWFALFKRLGNVGIYSASEDFVLREITGRIKREFESNQKLRVFFGDMKTDKWTESFFILKNGISFEGGGIGGQLRGGRKALIGLDDLENNETVLSEDQRDKIKQNINKELLPKLIPEGQMIYFGTPIHQLAYINQLNNTPNNGWEKRKYDCYVDGVEAEGHELWTEMLPHVELQSRKAKMGQNAFSAEYRCNPVSAETAPIKEEQIRYWSELPRQYSCVITVDPAYSEDNQADYKVATVVAIDQNSNRYLIEYLRTHEPIGEFQNGIISLYLRYKGFLTALGIPNSGVEKAFFESFTRKCEERKIYPPIEELKNSFRSAETQVSVRNKKARIVAALQGLFGSGKYYIHANHLEAKDELLTIGSSQHDDIVDCMAYAEQVIQPIYFENKEFEDYQEEMESVDHGTTGYGI